MRVRCWDGSEAGPDAGVTVVFRRRQALRHCLWSPNELGRVRGYVSGDLDVEGNLFRRGVRWNLASRVVRAVRR